MKKIVFLILLFIFYLGVPVNAERIKQKPLEGYMIEKYKYDDFIYSPDEIVVIPKLQSVIVNGIRFNTNYLQSWNLTRFSNKNDVIEFDKKTHIAVVYLNYSAFQNECSTNYGNYDFSLVSEKSSFSVPFDKELTYFKNNTKKGYTSLYVSPHTNNYMMVAFRIPDGFDIENANLKMVYRNDNYEYMRFLFLINDHTFGELP